MNLNINGIKVSVAEDMVAECVRQRLLGMPSVINGTLVPPAIGEVWEGQGGRYAGVCAGQDGAPDYYLIVGDDDRDEIAWQPAMDWAAALEMDGHRDFTLPDRREQPILFGNMGRLFHERYYWSRTQHASNSDCAWIQSFDYGDQSSSLKSDISRARAVRRIPIR